MAIISKTALLAAIDALFVNNLDGDIEADLEADLLNDLVDSLFGKHGGLYVTGGAVAQSLSTTPAKITAWAATFSGAGVTPSDTTDDITVLTAGVYKVSVSLTLTSASGTLLRFAIRNNGTAVNGGSARISSNGTDTYNISFSFLVTCAANDVLTVYGESGSGGGINTTIIDGQFYATGVS